jgi:PAS domain S-box-containing protein
MKVRDHLLLKHTTARYLFAVAAVAAATALRALLSPVTGSSGPFVLFFAALLATSLYAGTGPAFLALVTSVPIAGYMLVVSTGASVSQASLHSLFYAVDGLIILYVTEIMSRRQRSLNDVNHALRALSEVAARSEAHAREIIELSPDAFFLADLDARFTSVNRAACRLLGYEHDELVGMTIFDVIRPEDAARLEATRSKLLVPGATIRNEWDLKRKDGTLVPVEVSANILDDGRWQAFVRDITDRRRIDDQQQVFVSLLDNSVDFIGVADPGGKPIYLNAAGRRMIGLAPDFPVETLQIEDCYPPELRSFATNVILKTMTERGVWSGDTFFRSFQTHERIPVSDTHFVIRDASGKRVLGFGTVTRDMTDARRIAEERERLLTREQSARHDLETANSQLRESEERFRLTIDDAPIGMALVALDGRFVRVNRVLCEISGYTADELTKLKYQDITHKDDVEADVVLSQRLARGEIPRYQLEKRYIRKDGSIVDIMLSRSILRGPDGTPLYYIAEMEEITERKRAERALRLSEAKFSGIVSIAADAIISADENQRIIVFNEGAEQIFGYTKNEMIGAPFERLIPERYRAKYKEDFARFAAGDEASRRMAERDEVFGVRKNGEEFPAEASVSKVTVGDATFFSVVLRDVTDRKNVEAALHRAVAARDDVLGIVAHDLRNPLSAIMMAASAMDRPGPEPDRRDREPRDIILRASQRMNQLISDLLDVAQIEVGQLKLEPTHLSATDLVDEVVTAQTPFAEAADLELRREVGDDVRAVWGDHRRLLQVFENLIGNAIKFTEPRGQIVVGAATKERNVVFSVSDTGPGIAPDSVAHIFDRFWQAATRERRLGAGLGLQITKGIVEAHDGRIWVESELGHGTTFFFTIPIPQEGIADSRGRPSRGGREVRVEKAAAASPTD